MPAHNSCFVLLLGRVKDDFIQRKYEQFKGNSSHWSIFGPGITSQGFAQKSKWILPGKQEVTKADVCWTQLPISPQVAKSFNLLSEETTTAQHIISEGIRFRAQHSFIIHSQPSAFLQTHIIKPQLIIKYLTKTLQYTDCSYQGSQSCTDWFLSVWSSVCIKQHGCFEISNHKDKFGWSVVLKRKWFPSPMNIFIMYCWKRKSRTKSWNLKKDLQSENIHLYLVHSKKLFYIDMKYLAILIYYYNVIQFLKGKFLSNGNIFTFLFLKESPLKFWGKQEQFS